MFSGKIVPGLCLSYAPIDPAPSGAAWVEKDGSRGSILGDGINERADGRDRDADLIA